MPKKTLTTSLDNDLQKEIKKLAIDLERPLNDLLEESIKDLLKKYSSKKKKWGSQEKTATVNAVYLSFPSIAGHSSSPPSSLRNCAISALIAARSDSISA